MVQRVPSGRILQMLHNFSLHNFLIDKSASLLSKSNSLELARFTYKENLPTCVLFVLLFNTALNSIPKGLMGL